MWSQSVDYGTVRQVLNGTEHSAKTRGLYNASDSGSESTCQQLHNALSVALYRPLNHEIYLDLCRTKRYSNLPFLHAPSLKRRCCCCCWRDRRKLRILFRKRIAVVRGYRQRLPVREALNAYRRRRPKAAGRGHLNFLRCADAA